VKQLVRAANGVPEADAFAAQRKVMGDLTSSADVREGMTAFAERRAPKWTGK
jgi:enoyl-CoA hydratase/carnithine racemase